MTDLSVISIIGPDGAGKSTQAEKLVERLDQQDIDCEYRWFGAKHLLTLPLLLYARLVGLSEVEKLESGREIGYHYFWRSKLLSTLYPIFLFIDTLLIYFLQIYIPAVLFERTMVCDRFIHDIVVRAMLSIGNDSLYQTYLGAAFLSLVPDQSVIVLLDGDTETFRSRRDDVREDKTLGKMIDLYDELAESTDVHRIDASKSPEQIHAEICDLLSA